jgi:heterodisulfide reductase subunit A
MTARDKNRIAVIGAGPAGMAAAFSAASLGLEVDWYEKDDRPGGKLNGYHELFPDRILAGRALTVLERDDRAPVNRHFGRAIDKIETDGGRMILLSGEEIAGYADAVVVATGFDFFDARLKEEYGYGIYDHVITSPDLEAMLRDGGGALHLHGGEPRSVGFVHCVGSRDLQAGNPYCSRLCCMTGIKQAVELRERFPECRVTSFYIDIRAFGNGYEELYRKAQEDYRVRFVRGRVSEASRDPSGRIVVKAEDTLMGRPLKVTVDWLVLLVGMEPSCTAVRIDGSHVENAESGFYRLADPLSGLRLDGFKGIFTAGAGTGPMSVPEAIASGRSAAVEVWSFLNHANR